MTRLLGLVALLTVGCSCPSVAQDITVFTGRTMGPIPYNIRAVLPADVAAEEVKTQIVDVLKGVNDRMSTYLEDSELSRFNRSEAVHTWIDVSTETATVVHYALQVAELTGGAFDPTVGPAVNLWGFGPNKDRRQLPTDDQIEAARQRVGYKKVEARLAPPALRKSRADVALDLSAVAKGYAVDQVGALLGKLGCEAYMVEIGGEVVARGRKPGNHPWNIGLERVGQFTSEGEPQIAHEMVPLEDAALASSGDYRNYYEYEGRRYSHTIDPTTARPVEHQLAIASVRADTCMEADALATTLLVMGPKQGLAWAEQRGVAARLVERNDGRAEEHRTTTWQLAFGQQGPHSNHQAAEGSSMWMYIIVAVVFALAMLAMASGVIITGRRIKGSCGGLAGRQDEFGNTVCSSCSNPSPSCAGDSAAKGAPQEQESNP